MCKTNRVVRCTFMNGAYSARRNELSCLKPYMYFARSLGENMAGLCLALYYSPHDIEYVIEK